MRDPGGAPATYEYSSEGWQTTRIPWLYCVSCTGTFARDEDHKTAWRYSALGQALEITRGGSPGQKDTFTYDSHGLLTNAHLGAGLTHAVSGTAVVGQATQGELRTETAYDTLDRPTKARHWTATDDRCRFTSFTYDLHGNLTQRLEDGEEQRNQGTDTCTTTQLASPVTRTLTYDHADQLRTDALPDTRVTLDYWQNTGRLKQRKVETGSGGANWAVQQTIDYDPFATGQIYRQTTKNGSGTTTEEHVLSYDDAAGKYVGHRTQDVFTLQSPTSTACSGSACTATYTYDPRGRLVATQDGHGGSITYTLDAQGNVTSESATLSGTTVTRTFFYSHDVHEGLPPSNQLVRIEDGATPGNVLAKYFYDARGNLACVTTDAWDPPTPSDADTRCPDVVEGQASDASLLEHYAHDDFDRLIGTTGFVSQTVVRPASYVYDPLDLPHISSPRTFNRLGWVSRDRRSRSHLPPSRVITGSTGVHAGPCRRSRTSQSRSFR